MASNVNVDWSGAVLPIMTAFTLAQFITLLCLAILYFNFLLFNEYLETIIWVSSLGCRPLPWRE